jgi:GxxExxY protein
MENNNGKTKLLYENETFLLNGISYKVQNELGRFAREKQYCDLYEKYLPEAKIPYQRELTLADTGNRLDFLVFGRIPIEMKAKPFLTKDDYYQMQRYLQALNMDLGLIYNFRDTYIKPKRILRETRKNPQLSAYPDTIRKSGSGKFMTISFAICAHNEEKYIGPTIQSILDCMPENVLEILVINNASTDNTASVASAFPKVRVVDEPVKGLTRARQAGLKAASGDLLACVDADTHVTKEWFEILNREFEKDSSLVCLSGPYEFYDLPGSKMFLGLLMKIWYKIAQFIAIFTGYLVQGGNFVAKKEALEKIGGFDTNIEFYGEDTNIARRLHEVGKVKFMSSFSAQSSARRLNAHGLFHLAYLYGANFLSEVVLKRPVTKKYKDFR